MGIPKWWVLKLIIPGVILYSGLIGYLSIGRISVPVNIQFDFSDKIGHFVAYFGLATIWFLYFFLIRKKSSDRSLLYAISIAVLFGIFMEGLQSWLTDYRTADWFDIFANTGGAILAGIFIKLNLKYIRQIKNNM